MTITIDCPKNIKVLHIEFNDGDVNTSPEITKKTVQTSSNTSNPHKREPVKVKETSDKITYLDTSDTDSVKPVAQIFEKPKVEIAERPPMVANDMNKLDL